MILKYIAECFSGQPVTHKYPYCLVSIVMLPGEIDANLEPNKTQVLLKDEVCPYLDGYLYIVLVCLLI
jgi:DNA mismatch repair ATPase MutL